jgi:hypothetical protein
MVKLILSSGYVALVDPCQIVIDEKEFSNVVVGATMMEEYYKDGKRVGVFLTTSSDGCSELVYSKCGNLFSVDYPPLSEESFDEYGNKEQDDDKDSDIDDNSNDKEDEKRFMINTDTAIFLLCDPKSFLSVDEFKELEKNKTFPRMFKDMVVLKYKEDQVINIVLQEYNSSHEVDNFSVHALPCRNKA